MVIAVEDDRIPLQQGREGGGTERHPASGHDHGTDVVEREPSLFLLRRTANQKTAFASNERPVLEDVQNMMAHNSPSF